MTNPPNVNAFFKFYLPGGKHRSFYSSSVKGSGYDYMTYVDTGVKAGKVQDYMDYAGNGIPRSHRPFKSSLTAWRMDEQYSLFISDPTEQGLVEACRGGQKIDYELGQKLSEYGNYEITFKDKLANQKIYLFDLKF